LNLLYQSVLQIATGYLGPASERFIRRQVNQHLYKDPEALSRKDIPELANRVHISIGPSVADPKVADEFRLKLLALA
jgi:hypothetical protein